MLRTLYVVGAGGAELVDARAEFPTVAVTEVPAPPPGLPFLDGARLFARDGWTRDLQLAEGVARHGALAVVPGPHDLVAILTRYQRLVERRNLASASAAFDRVLERHRALHDLDKALVRADFDHARDVWQWLVRLAPSASLAVQVAALFHDVERLTSEADRRVEHEAPDYDAFKAAHARAGAGLMRAALDGCVDAATLDRAAELVARHEGGSEPPPADPRRAGDDERQLLADADGLSFFSLNSPGFADYYGPEHTRKKVAWTLGRLSPRGRAHLHALALRDDVRAFIKREEAA